MSAEQDGGPAFPNDRVVSNGCVEQYESTGMSLRDYFAAKALQAIVCKMPVMNPAPEDWIASMAAGAYQYADAMLTERDK